MLRGQVVPLQVHGYWQMVALQLTLAVLLLLLCLLLVVRQAMRLTLLEWRLLP